MSEWLFVSFGRTESLKLQQPKIQKPLHSPRSEEVKDEESKQLATSCPKSLHYATLPLSCVFPSICERWMCKRGSTGMCDFLGERLVRVDFQHPFHFEKFVSKNQQFPSIILKLNIITCKWMKTRGLGDGERTVYYSQSVVNKADCTYINSKANGCNQPRVQSVINLLCSQWEGFPNKIISLHLVAHPCFF